VHNNPVAYPYLNLPSYATWAACNPSIGFFEASPACGSVITNTHAVGFPRVVNIWVMGDSSARGAPAYAHLPNLSSESPSHSLVCLHWDLVDGAGLRNAGTQQAGAMLTKMMGDQMGLQETFAGNVISHSCAGDDGVADTPRSLRPGAQSTT
jgi:hypothetical protein